MVCAWPRIMSPRSAWFFSICWRSSGRGVEDDALAEDRRHERVRRRLVERRVGRPEELLVGLGAGDQHDVAVGQPEPADVAALLADPLEQRRSGRPASRRGGRSRRRGTAYETSGIASTVGRAHRSSTGASGLTSTRFRWTPRGALTTMAIASAIAAGLQEVRGAGRGPNRTHWLSTNGAVVGVPVAAHLAPGRAGPHDAGADAGALELHLQRGDQPLEPPLARRSRPP